MKCDRIISCFYCKKILFFLGFILFCLVITPSFGQNKILDSLKLVLKTAKHDTTKGNVLLEMINTENDMKVWSKYNDELIKMAGDHLKDTTDLTKKIDRVLINTYKKQLAGAINNSGYIHSSKGDITKALKDFIESLRLTEEILDKNGRPTDKKGIALSLNSIGSVYFNQGNIPKALEYFERSLGFQEETGDKFGIAYNLNNMGIIHQQQGDTIKALEYYLKCVEIREQISDKKGLSYSLVNIGSVYQKRKDFEKALEYYNKSLNIQNEIHEEKGKAGTLINIGSLYHEQKDLEKALEFYRSSLAVCEGLQDKKGISFVLRNIGAVYLQEKKYNEALLYCSKSLALSQEIGVPDNIQSAARLLYQTHKATGEYKLALKCYELYIQMRDSISNQNNRKASIRSQLKYEYEKQAAADSVVHAKESEIKNAELAKQKAEIKAKKNQQYALFGGLFAVCVFGAFMYNRFKVTQKQKEIIEEQKEVVEEQKKLVEEKQKEVLDSIHYAKKIQMAQIPNEKQVGKNLEKLRKT